MFEQPFFVLDRPPSVYGFWAFFLGRGLPLPVGASMWSLLSLWIYLFAPCAFFRFRDTLPGIDVVRNPAMRDSFPLFL